ncbi:unnamed protein product [Blepharisma stoltei]|uniref:RRM domain-containing protein n=1 Tax=Blepharisma stoltei TaxID=1481888 RepID=A0AAU9K8H1_9CILI|nr:unnamed protein product [Blepharisma stoltei]
MTELSKLFGSDKSSDLFSGTPFEPPKPIKPIIPEETPEAPQKDEKSREDRLIFVGNVDISTKKKQIKKLFGQYGEIEKVWERSVPVERGKLPIKAAVALKMYKDGASACNFYVLYKNPEDAKQSLDLNGQDFKGSHLRVDFAEKPKKEIKNSIFIGNLAFDTKDEELWEEFKEFGEIDYVRIIRDHATHMGKGFAYVAFKEKDSAVRALSKNNAEFKGRSLRVHKAKSDKQLEKDKEKPKNMGAMRFRNKSKELKNAYELPEEYKMQENVQIMEGRPKNRKKNAKPDYTVKKKMKKEQNKLKEKIKKRKEDSKPTKKSKKDKS